MTKKNEIPMVDHWKPNQEDIFFTTAKDIMIGPIAQFYHLENPENARINFFWIKPKKSYNSDLLRQHCCDYINYFEKTR